MAEERTAAEIFETLTAQADTLMAQVRAWLDKH